MIFAFTGKKSTWSWCMILLMCLLNSVCYYLLRNFAFIFTKNLLSYDFLFLQCSCLVFTWSQWWSNKMSLAVSCLQFCKSLRRTSLVAQMVNHLPTNAGELGSIPGSGWSSGEGNGNPLQYSCLENPMERGVW